MRGCVRQRHVLLEPGDPVETRLEYSPDRCPGWPEPSVCTRSIQLHGAGFDSAKPTNWLCDLMRVTSSPGPYFLSPLKMEESGH